ncbi:hypothetical protein [Streptomyces avermitilis]|uniref:hypothetical protein n=1 Tax=Streptomyces avermitilis TaxID=33903 RepID=UPI003F54047B
MLEQPVHGLPALGLAMLGVRQFDGVGTAQVVQGVPAEGVLVDEVHAGELGQQQPRLPHREPGEGGRGRGRVKSGPGCSPSSRKRPAAGESAREDQEKTAPPSADASALVKASRLPWASRSSAAMADSEKCGWVAARAAAQARASGSPAHSAV